MDYINGKVIIITGAASGFGKLIAQKAASRGAKIVAADVNDGDLAACTEEITAAGGEALGIQTDVTNADSMHALAEAAVKHFGQIDVMINNAGIMPLAFFADHKEAAAAWRRCIDINFTGVLNGIVAVYDQMMAQERGHIINLSSIYANHPVQGAAVYGATKAAVAFLSDALRQESHGRIKVTTVRPTGVPDTGIASAVVNANSYVGLLGSNTAVFEEQMAKVAETGELPELGDVNSPSYSPLNADTLTEHVLYAINQPWGVSVSDVTVRATGDMYVI